MVLFYSKNQTFKLFRTIVLFLLIRDPRNNYTIVLLLNVSQGQIWLQILSIVINQAVIKKTFLHQVVENRTCWILTSWVAFWVYKLGALNFFTQCSYELKASPWFSRQEEATKTSNSQLYRMGCRSAYQNTYSSTTCNLSDMEILHQQELFPFVFWTIIVYFLLRWQINIMKGKTTSKKTFRKYFTYGKIVDMEA